MGKDGTMAANLLDGSTTVLGNIELARFMNNGGLVALGDNLYGESQASGQPMLGTRVIEGFR